MCAHCHVVTLEIKLTDLEAIRRACKRMGWELVENQATYKWVGIWVDDSPVPRHLFESEEEYNRVCAMTKPERRDFMPTILGKCTHAIKLPGVDGEIGLIQRGKEFVPIWDYYTHGLHRVRTDNGMDGFVQSYATEKAKLEAQRRGKYVTEHKLPNGAIQIQIHG